MAVSDARERIQAAVLAWPHMSAHPHRYNAVEFRYGTREIGHLHGGSLLDIPFPTKVRDDLVAKGQAQPHHVLPDSGWISFYVRADVDVGAAIALLRRSYEIAAKQKPKQKEDQ